MLSSLENVLHCVTAWNITKILTCFLSSPNPLFRTTSAELISSSCHGTQCSVAVPIHAAMTHIPPFQNRLAILCPLLSAGVIFMMYIVVQRPGIFSICKRPAVLSLHTDCSLSLWKGLFFQRQLLQMYASHFPFAIVYSLAKNAHK